MRLAEQVGFAVGSLRDVEVEDGLERALEKNYSSVEICGDESLSDQGFRGLWPWESKMWDYIEPMLGEFNLTAYHAPYQGLNPLTMNPVIRDAAIKQIKAAIDIASEMDLSPVIVHPGLPRENMNERVERFLIEKFLTEIASYAEEKRVQVAVETCEIFENISILEEYIAKIDSAYIGICLDLRDDMIKLNDLDNQKIADFINKADDRLFHVRLHNINTELISHEKTVETLAKADYPGAVIFNIYENDFEQMDKTRQGFYKVG